MYYWRIFWQLNFHVQHHIWIKNLIKVYSPHLYASFDTICVQNSQLFAAQRVFKHSEEFWNRPSKTAICRFANMQRLTVPRMIGQFGRKRCQKKRKDMDYKILLEFFKNTLLCLNGWLSKNSYVRYALDVFFGWICRSDQEVIVHETLIPFVQVSSRFFMAFPIK